MGVGPHAPRAAHQASEQNFEHVQTLGKKLKTIPYAFRDGGGLYLVVDSCGIAIRVLGTPKRVFELLERCAQFSVLSPPFDLPDIALLNTPATADRGGLHAEGNASEPRREACVRGDHRIRTNSSFDRGYSDLNELLHL